MTFNILFVCTGNTCRSPMAEAAARNEVHRRGWSHVEVRSAGVHAEAGEPASGNAVAVGSRSGLTLQGHRAQLLTPELVEWADLVLAMTSSHVTAVAVLGGEEKVALLGEFGSPDGKGGGVSDPFGGDEATYAETLDELQRLVAGALDRVAPFVAP